MSKHGIDLLKRRLRDKVSGLQSDSENVQARLGNDESIQANLKRCEEKLTTKLEGSFTELYKMLEQYKQELNGRVNVLFSHHRQAITKQNEALQECLGGVNKACADAEELLTESDKSTFLAAHNKVSQRLEECFVNLLMLEESDSCSISFTEIESLERKIESFCLKDQLPSFDTGMKKLYVKENISDQELKPPTVPVSSPLTPTISQDLATPTVFTGNAISTSVHLPFVFTSPTSSIPVPSSTLTSPVSLSSDNFISSPLVSVNTNFGITQSSGLSSFSSMGVHAPASTLKNAASTTSTMSTLASLLEVSSISEFVPKAVLTSQLVSTSEAKPSVSVTKSSFPVTKAPVPVTTVTKILTSMSKIQTLAPVSTTKDSSTSKSIPARSISKTSSVHSSKVGAAIRSVAAASSVKKPKTSSTVALHSKHRTIDNVKIGYLCDVKQGTEMECVVPEVASPSEFWIQPVNYELIRLMKNMEFHYAQLERKGDLGGMEGLPRAGDFCCARYLQDSKWYRARVLSVDVHGSTTHHIKVLYIDYGNQEEVSLSSLRPLDSRFTYLPCQAIKCSLKVKPFIELSSPELKGYGIPQWPEHTKKWFRSLLTGKHVTVLFLTANSSNHAQVDVAINRELFLSSLSCLHGVLSITEGVKQFLQSTHFFALFGVSSFMCVVKLAVFNDDRCLTNHLFCGPSVFAFPAPSPVFMHPFSSMPPQHSLFPVVRYCNAPSLPETFSPATFSPGFIQPVVSPSSSLNLSDETSPENEPQCQSEQFTTANQKSVLKKRTASLSGLETDDLVLSDLPVELRSRASCGEKMSKLSSQELEEQPLPECGASTTPEATDTTAEAIVALSISSNDSSSSSFVDVATSGQDCNTFLSVSTSSHSSKPLIPNLYSSSGLCESTPVVTTVAQSPAPTPPSPLVEKDCTLSVPTSDSHCEVENLTRASSPLSAVTVRSESPECNKNMLNAITKRDDCIKFHTIAALPLLSSVISNDSDHYSVIVSHVISPSEFYLNFASDTEEVKNFDSFQQSLHNHCLTETKVEEDLSENLTVGVVCSAKYTDGTWNRGIIRSVQPMMSKEGDKKKYKYLMQYIDYGNYHWVPIDNIKSLQEEFLSQPALTFRCSLTGVVPGRVKRGQQKKRNLSSKVLMTAAGSEDDFQELEQDSEELFIHDNQDVFESAKESKAYHQEWSQEATDRFVHLTYGKVLVAALNEEVMMLSWDDILEVELIDTNGAIDIIIADDLVSRGYAQYRTNKSAKIDGEISYQNQVEPDSRSSLRSDSVSTAKVTEDASLLSPTVAALDAWNPMESHFLSNWNLYKDNAKDTLLENGGRGFRTRRNKQDATLRDPAMVAKSWKAQMASLPAENTCVQIVITAVYSPVRFWAQLTSPTTANIDEEEDRNKYEVTLTQLCEEMNQQYSHSVFKGRERELIAHGEMVAALSPDDQCWYRALLKDFDDNTNTVLVAFVDYGDTAWILEANVRHLHQKFIHLPIQAVECTLDGLKVNEEVDFNWAVQTFLEIVKDKGFAGHVIERDTVLHRLSLELYESSSTGALINLKNVLISKNIAVRTAIGIIGSGPGGSGGHKKNTISLPG